MGSRPIPEATVVQAGVLETAGAEREPTVEKHPMTTEKKGLVRETGTVRPRSGRLERSRVERGRDRDDDRRRDGDTAEDDEEPGRRDRVRARQGRPPLRDEVNDLNRGGAFVAAESLAVAFDVASRVLRGAVDRAFDEDYNEPGDVIRGLANEADLAAYDLVDEMRTVPRRLDRRFEEAIRSPRADRGERSRRDEDERSSRSR